MSHWLQTVIDLLEAETSNLRELAILAGADPRTFYVGVKLEDLDIRGQDLRGMTFTNFDPKRVLADEKTEFDSSYQNRPSDQLYKDSGGHGSGDEEWALEWLKRWQREKGPKTRSELAEEATNRLSIRPPNNQYWAAVWQHVWLSERRDSDRRNHLFEIAFHHLSKAESGEISWLSIWIRLWKHTNEPNRVSLELFLKSAIAWFTKLDLSDERWAKTWRELWKAARSAQLHSNELILRGFAFLRDNPNHENWGTVWRDLWESRNKEHRKELLPMAMSWLVEVDDRHSGWTPVWRRVWKISEPPGNMDLINVAAWWLDRNLQDFAWPSIWLLLERSAHSKQQRSWLSEMSMLWMPQARTKERDWPLVWSRTWDLNEDALVQKDLMRLARDWLRTHMDYENWFDVWRRMSSFETDERQRDELEHLARLWRTLHNLTEHTFRLMLEIPLPKKHAKRISTRTR